MNENKFVRNGKEYVAVPYEGCSGCAFYDDQASCRKSIERG